MVNNDFMDIFSQVREMLPTIRLRHGGDGGPKKPKARVHPMVKVKIYVEKHNLRLIDFFNKFDKDGSMSVTHEEFEEGIKVVFLEFWYKYLIFFYHVFPPLYFFLIIS